MYVTAQFRGVDGALRGLLDSLDEELSLAAARGAEIIAWAARADHWYHNQTHETHRTTDPRMPTGRWSASWSGVLTFGVVVGTPYSGYLEARESFLAPAFFISLHRLELELDEGLRRAVARTPGWSSG